MPTLEKEASPIVHATDRPGFKRFMHEWEEKLHHHIDAEEEKNKQRESRFEPEHEKAA